MSLTNCRVEWKQEGRAFAASMNHTCPDAHTPFKLTPSLAPPLTLLLVLW